MIFIGLNDISTNSNYLYRITAIQALAFLKDIMPSKDLS